MGIPAPAGVGASGVPPAGDRANAVLTGTFAAIGPGKPFAFVGNMNLLIYASYVDNTGLVTANGSGTATVGTGTGLAIGGSINSVNVPKGTTWLTYSGTSGTLAFPVVTWYGKSDTKVARITNLQSTAGLLGSTVSGLGLSTGVTVLAIVNAAVASSGLNDGIVQISSIPSATAGTALIPFEFALTNQSVTTGTDTSAVFTGAGITMSGTFQLERSFDGGSTWVLANIGGAGSPAQWIGATQTPISITFGEPENMVLYRLNCISVTNSTGKTTNYRISQTGGAALSLSLGSPI